MIPVSSKLFHHLLLEYISLRCWHLITKLVHGWVSFQILPQSRYFENCIHSWKDCKNPDIWVNLSYISLSYKELYSKISHKNICVIFLKNCHEKSTLINLRCYVAEKYTLPLLKIYIWEIGGKSIQIASTKHEILKLKMCYWLQLGLTWSLDNIRCLWKSLSSCSLRPLEAGKSPRQCWPNLE